MSRAKSFESGPQDVERPLLAPGDAAFDELPADAGTAPDALRRLASARERGRLAHAVLLAGPPGCGKRWVAARLAQLLACLQPVDGTPCRRCSECVRTERGLDPAVFVLEQPWDERKGERKGEIPVEQVRRVQEQLAFRATSRRLVIVDPADRLSLVAQEALLKTLEEPPAGVTLVLLTSRPSYLKPTIRSRAPMLRVLPPRRESLAGLLASRRSLEAGEADLAARLSGGDVRAALELDASDVADRWLSVARSIYEVLGPKGERRARDLAVDVAPSKEEGGGRSDVAAFLTLLERILRDAVIAGSMESEESLLNPQAAKAARSIAQRLPPPIAARAMELVEIARDDLALNMNVKVLLSHLLLGLHALATESSPVVGGGA